MAEITVTKDNFETAVLQVAQPVLLDFWATWCGPCRMLAPVLEQLAQELDGKITVGKINVDDEPELANAFQIESIPTLVVMRDGKPVKMAVGYQQREQILALLDE